MTQVWVEADNQKHLIANLSRQMPQYAPDLGFQKGATIAFFITGAGDVHLNGYQVLDDAADKLATPMKNEIT